VSYIYTQFGSLVIPTLSPAGDEGRSVSLGPARDGLVRLPGGWAYDAYGTEQSPLDAQTIEVGAVLQAATQMLLDAEFSAWRAGVGMRAALYREWQGDYSQQWRLARLLEVRVQQFVPTRPWLSISLVFALLGDRWHGEARLIETTLDSVPKIIPCFNGGNIPVRDAIVTITAVGSSITQVDLTMTGVALRWTGVLAAGTDLAIDCGRKVITNDGDPAYAGLTFGPAHESSDWLPLMPGANSLSVSRSGGGAASEIAIAYDDGWL